MWLLGLTTTTAVSPKCTHHNPGERGARRCWWRNLSVPPPILLFLSTFVISPLPPSIRSCQYHPLISNSGTLPQSDVFTQIWDRSRTGAISLGVFHKKLFMQPILDLKLQKKLQQWKHLFFKCLKGFSIELNSIWKLTNGLLLLISYIYNLQMYLELSKLV